MKKKYIKMNVDDNHLSFGNLCRLIKLQAKNKSSAMQSEVFCTLFNVDSINDTTINNYCVGVRGINDNYKQTYINYQKKYINDKNILKDTIIDLISIIDGRLYDSTYDVNKSESLKHLCLKLYNISKNDHDCSEEFSKHLSSLINKNNLLEAISEILFFVILYPKMTAPKTVEIPDVTNMTVVKAIETLQEEGFTVSSEQIEKSSTVVEEGKIISTSPAGGTKHKKGYEVTLYVSTGNKSIEVEDYTGKNYLEVKGKLEAYGINVFIEEKEIEADADDGYEKDIIMDQSIKKGESLSKGDNITLYIPDIKNVYPYFTDGTYIVSDIIAFAKEYKISVKFIDSEGKTISINSENAYEYDDYQILNQNRKAGSVVTSGVSIIIKLDTSSTGSENTCEEGGLC